MRHCADIQSRAGFAVKSITPRTRAARPRHATAPARHAVRPCARIDRKPGPIGPCRAPIDPRPLVRMGSDCPRTHWPGKRSANRANMPPGGCPRMGRKPAQNGPQTVPHAMAPDRSANRQAGPTPGKYVSAN